MAHSILVALNQPELIDQFMPCLKLTAQPGDEVIFLVRPATAKWGEVESHLPMVETGSITGVEYREIAWRFNIDREKERVERKLASAREALRRKGVNTEVKMYARSLSKALREHSKASAPRLIIRPTKYCFIKAFTDFLAARSYPHTTTYRHWLAEPFEIGSPRVEGTFILQKLWKTRLITRFRTRRAP